MMMKKATFLVSAAIVATTSGARNFKYRPVYTDDLSIGFTTGEHWQFQPSMSDEFAGTTLSNKWTTSFEGWDGIPPAAFTSNNVNRDTSGKASISLTRNEGFDFSSVGGNDNGQCACDYEQYTTGMLMSTFDFGDDASSGWAVEINARPANANVQSNIWFQGDGGEFSAFEMNSKDSERRANTVCKAAFHTFDEESTTASHVVQNDLCSTNVFRKYGMMWKDGTFTTSVNGVVASVVDLNAVNGDYSNIAKNFKLIMDVFVNTTNGLPHDDDLPAALTVDYVRVWKAVSNEGYARHTTTSGICDSKGSTRAVIPRILGTGATYEECAAVCDSTYDCFHFTLNRNGACFLFKECNVLSVSTKTMRFDRLEANVPPVPEVSPIDGYTSFANDALCDINDESVTYAPKKFGGSDRTLEQCAAACNKQLNCEYISLSKAGYCKMTVGCTSTKSKNNAVVFKRDRYKKLSIENRCDKDQNPLDYSSAGGKGHSLEDCQAACDNSKSCSFIVWYALKGYCHYFSGACKQQTGAQGGSQLFARVGGAPEPAVAGFTMQSGKQCNKNDREANVRASPYSLGGGGHSFLDCSAACSANAECNFFQHSNTGYCNMFNTCTVQINVQVSEKKMFSRNAGDSLTLDSTKTALSTSPTSSTKIFVFGALLAMAAVGVTTWRRRKATKASSAYAQLSPAKSSSLTSTVGDRNEAEAPLLSGAGDPNIAFYT